MTEALADATPVVIGRGLGRPVTDTRAHRRLLRLEVALLLVSGAAAGIWALYEQVSAVADAHGRWVALGYAGIVPPVLIALVWWLNAVRPLRWPVLVVAFAWGACGASLLALHLNQWMAPYVGDSQGPSARGAVFVAPWTEEAAKAIVVLALAAWSSYRFDSVTSGAVVGALSGIGFAFAENIFYFASAYSHAVATGQADTATDAVQQVFVLRGVVSPFVHPMFTMATGIGAGLAVRHRHTALRVLAPVAGFVVAVCLHMGYNTLASFSSPVGFRVAYVAILLPIVLTLVVVVAVVRRYESRLLAVRLGDYVRHGWLTPAHVTYAMTRRGRRRARRHVRPLGRPAVRRVRQFQAQAQRLAVTRDRMVRRVTPPEASAEESAALERLREMRRHLVLPERDDADDARLTRATSSW